MARLDPGGIGDLRSKYWGVLNAGVSELKNADQSVLYPMGTRYTYISPRSSTGRTDKFPNGLNVSIGKKSQQMVGHGEIQDIKSAHMSEKVAMVKLSFFLDTLVDNNQMNLSLYINLYQLRASSPGQCPPLCTTFAQPSYSPPQTLELVPILVTNTR